MKAITLTQPWATLVALGVKQIETRSWQTPHRGQLAIHAAKKWSDDDRHFGLELIAEGIIPNEHHGDVIFPQGEILAIVTLTDVVESIVAVDGGLVSDREERFGDFSPGRYAWVLSGLQRLSVPVPAKGALGVWQVPPDVFMKVIGTRMES